MEFFSFSDTDWVQNEDTSELFSRIGRIDGRLSLDSEVSIRERRLPMYQDARLLCLTSDKWEAGLKVCFVEHDHNLFRLNGTSPPVHELNAKVPITITDENVFYYLSFFCFFVRGDEGPFYVLYDLDDNMLPPDLSPARGGTNPDAQRLQWVFQRPRIVGRDEKDNWRASALIFYSNAIFLSDFVIEPAGMITLVNDEPLLADLACRIDAPLTPSAHLA